MLVVVAAASGFTIGNEELPDHPTWLHWSVPDPVAAGTEHQDQPPARMRAQRMSELLAFDQVIAGYGDAVVLDGMSFAMQQGESLAERFGEGARRQSQLGLRTAFPQPGQQNLAIGDAGFAHDQEGA